MILVLMEVNMILKNLFLTNIYTYYKCVQKLQFKIKEVKTLNSLIILGIIKIVICVCDLEKMKIVHIATVLLRVRILLTVMILTNVKTVMKIQGVLNAMLAFIV